MCDLLFVYGTLRRGFDNPHASLLHARSEFIGEATVRGTTCAVGDHRAFLPGTDGEVHGELYRLETPVATLAALDDYEGDEYERVIVDASGQPAWIYQARR